MTDQPSLGADEAAPKSVAKKLSTPRGKAPKTAQSTSKKVEEAKEVKEVKKTSIAKKNSTSRPKKATSGKDAVSKQPAPRKTTKKPVANVTQEGNSPLVQESAALAPKEDKVVASSANNSPKKTTRKAKNTDKVAIDPENKEKKKPLPEEKKTSPNKTAPKKNSLQKEEVTKVKDASLPEEKEEQLVKRSAKGKKNAEKSIALDSQERQKPTKKQTGSSKRAKDLNTEIQTLPDTPQLLGEDSQSKKAVTASVEEVFAEDGAESTGLANAEVSEELSLEEGAKSNRRRGRRSRGRGKKNNQALDLSLEELSNEEELGQQLVAEASIESEAKAGSASTKETAPHALPESKARRKMFVSVLPDEQVEVVLCEEGQVQEYYVEMLQQAKSKGNIYKAVIHNVDANLQAAFVNYGAGKNGFLQIDEVHPEYYNVPHDQSKQSKYPPIQKALKPGQEILVQIVKEPTGNKGAFLTTYLSFAGRFLVLTPGREQVGVSRKVDDEKERTRLRDMLKDVNPGPGLGVIVRTVSIGASKTSLQKDLQLLKKIWKEVRTKGTKEESPSLIHQEIDLTTRAIRDYLTDQVTELWIDDEKTATAIAEVAKDLFPKKKNLVRLHKEESPSLFERFNVQRQLDQIHSREVTLPSGGRLVIDPTEALTAIDINSGKSGGKTNFEDMAYRTNMEAAKMIPLQLRLRDIGGQIVADFIEMRDRSHWREVEKVVRQGMKIDRARYDVGKIGPFGMLEIVRQRLGSSAISVSTEVCPYCKGTGVRHNMEWQSQQIFKDIQRQMRAAQAQKKTELVYEAEADLAFHLLNQKRQRLCDLEQITGVTLVIQPK